MSWRFPGVEAGYFSMAGVKNSGHWLIDEGILQVRFALEDTLYDQSPRPDDSAGVDMACVVMGIYCEKVVCPGNRVCRGQP